MRERGPKRKPTERAIRCPECDRIVGSVRGDRLLQPVQRYFWQRMHLPDGTPTSGRRVRNVKEGQKPEPGLTPVPYEVRGDSAGLLLSKGPITVECIAPTCAGLRIIGSASV